MGNWLCLDVATATQFLRHYIIASGDDLDIAPIIQVTTSPPPPPVLELVMSQPQLDASADRDPAEAHRECHEILQELFPMYRFRRCCPPFLINPESTDPMSLELYCPDLGLAVEYHDRHHFLYDPAVHRSIDDFRLTQLCDGLKKKLCDRHDVKLIIVPYSTPHLRDYLTRRLREALHPSRRESAEMAATQCN
jgi:hypothetical protein